MEALHFTFSGQSLSNTSHKPVLVGVVGSGNLEVLIEPATDASTCIVEIITAAVGFGAIWEAVIGDFVSRRKPAGIRVSINDVGATPAVVSLRLDQAWDSYREGQP